jgi:hypothetical protein
MLQSEPTHKIIEASDTSLTSNGKRKIFIIHKVKRKQSWIPFEDKILLMVARSYSCRNWRAIAQQMPNRTATQCYMRYNIIKNEYYKGIWIEEEDQYLKTLVKKYGKNWSKICKYHINKRTSKQIRDRFVNYLDPKLNRKPFTKKEDKKIIEMYLSHGRRWSYFAKLLKTRTSEMVKNRFHSVLYKKVHS